MLDENEHTHIYACRYLAYFPALAGCHTWGRTYEDAIAYAKEALAVYLETLADNGDPIPEERSDKPVSLGVWAFMPKCPMCIAAYVAVWTGLGLSLAAATYLRWSLLLVSSTVLIYLIGKRRFPALAGGFIRRFCDSQDTNPKR